MKGIIGIIIAIIVGALSIYGITLAVFIGRTEINSQSLIENGILHSINKMEFVKREIPLAMNYSFDQTVFDLGSRGGYITPQQAYNCVPYWQLFSSPNIPDYQTNMQTLFLNIFSKYTAALSDSSINLPSFQANIDKTGAITISSDKLLVAQNPGFYYIKDSSTFSEKVNPDLITMFDVGRDFSTELSKEISSASSYSDALDKINLLQSSFNAAYDNQYSFNVQPENNLGASETNFAMRVLVVISTNSPTKYPIFDFSQNKNALENMQLVYYVLSGTDDSVQPQTNECQPIQY